ncbi:thiamine diphosphate-binding protein [Pestalotiopsis sp. NC0098]|nr:thiamine diphosphate-binding protein [Pestalotiopsis sp. NC0098]
MKVAEYLFERLKQLGIGSIHGVPGDYNLSLLDYVEPAGLRWVGNANELNAAYAADAYARIKGISAVVTTFGVGELSAINGIAGAYAERAPVVHIVGIPNRESHEKRLLIHHTFADGEYDRFAQMHAHVAVAQIRLWNAGASPEQIDNTLQQCLLHSRPVYIAIPVDVVEVEIPGALAERLQSPLQPIKAAVADLQDTVLDNLVSKIQAAKQPIIIVDGEIRPMGIVGEVQKLMQCTGWPTWTTPFGKGLLDETVSNFHGLYQGKFDQAKVREFVEGADLILCFGPHWSSTNTYTYTTIPKPEVTVSFTDASIEFGGQKYRDVSVKSTLTRITEFLEDGSSTPRYNPYPDLPRDYNLPLPDASETEPLTQDRLWRTLGNALRPGDILLGETGTPGHGIRVIPLPQHTRVFNPVTWLSIGYMVPAAQGAALAQKELLESSAYHGLSAGRTILVIGDGSFQMTAQELSTMVRHGLDVLVVLLNNDGYTIERCLHGYRQAYNDVAPWRYLQAPGFFGAPKGAYTGSARTFGELAQVLADVDGLGPGSGLSMVELFLDREDAPAGPLREALERQKANE